MFAWEMSNISKHIEALKATEKLSWHPLKAWTHRQQKQTQTRILRQILMGHLLQLTVDWHCSDTYSMSRTVVDVQRIKTGGESCGVIGWQRDFGTFGWRAFNNQSGPLQSACCPCYSVSSFTIKPSGVLVVMVTQQAKSTNQTMVMH